MRTTRNYISEAILRYHVVQCWTKICMLAGHSSEKRDSRFCSSEILQNLPNLYKKKTHIVFFFVFHFNQLKVARNKNGKKLHGFSFYISMANFEVFSWTKSWAQTSFFLKSRYVDVCTMENITEVYTLKLWVVKCTFFGKTC